MSLRDNVAADILLREIGGPSVQDGYVRSLGLDGFHLEDGEHGLHSDNQAQYRNCFEPAAAVQQERWVSVEMHLYPGVPHAWEWVASQAEVTRRAMENRVKWLKKLSA